MGSKKVILETFAEFKELTGREYKLVETYGQADADIAIVCLGSTFETAMLAIEQLREEGINACVVAPRVFRPFPLEEISEALQNMKAIACMDRSAPGGTVGTLYNEIAGALINSPARPLVSNLIYGLGGRDMTVSGLKDIFRTLDKEAKEGKLAGKIQRFVGVRGPELSFYEAQGVQK
jgi:pyruvate ferredoxin oxidoreductase alpha subunit